ncbi:coenzyme A pyrophosphatase [Compostibacillus humi]|uniref:Coenzyme A pyrophosphatase n=1 Tax=Compostibacillus humi TaxID=1245525 RepID=A0A8J3EIF6_9BACI|nr:CoA pyrophosphatase [Compostibacillus humi]GGH70353.1 coenzyme A pyrophosphatase [Compostibacillus humi]HLT54639.1 CoA pyrophosphatase [Bacillota bacterium]
MDIAKLLRTFQARKRKIMGTENYRKSAVLIPLLEKDGEIHILFQVRSLHLHSQPGDICFPGGRIEKTDGGPEDCAIRETSEELGIPPSSIADVIPFDYIVSDSGRMIFPYIGRIVHPEKIKPNEAEVAETFTVPLQYLLNTEPKMYKVHLQVLPEKDFPYHWIHGGKDYQWGKRSIDELFYPYEDKVIWGLTAKILTYFLQEIKENQDNK